MAQDRVRRRIINALARLDNRSRGGKIVDLAVMRAGTMDAGIAALAGMSSDRPRPADDLHRSLVPVITRSLRAELLGETR
jgi:hypothetical protein